MFLEKTIENWLTKTSELGYQFPFCELLVNEGYSIIHISKQNAFEQGKDIIALDKRDRPCVFQLKGGNISHKRWVREVKDEIEELIDLTITHPSVSKRKKHIPYLVTNGFLEDTVRLAIDNLNAGKWKHKPLQVITRGQLLRKFLELSRNFVPQEVQDYKSFLDLYFADGRELIDEDRYSKFIIEVLRLNESGLPAEERKRNIAAAILYTSYIISPFKELSNHISIIQTLVLLGSHILALVERFGIEDKYWVSSFELIWSEIKNNGKSLQKEIADDGLIMMINSWWDGEISPVRKHLAVSYLLAYKAGQIIEGDEDYLTISNDEFFSKLQGTIVLWGETSIIAYILLFEYLKKAKANDVGQIIRFLIEPLLALIIANGRKSQDGLPSPYYDATTLIKAKFNQLDEPIEEDFRCRSSLIKSLIDLLARYNRREELEELWREITYISQDKFIPYETWQTFLWRCSKGQGKKLSEFPKQTQSWKELVEEVSVIDYDSIPETLQRHHYFLPLFLLVYPHRVTNNLIKFFDYIVQ
jgi:hypothetical protein